MTETDIDMDVEMPDFSKERRGRKPKWPFRECVEVGTSFFVAGYTASTMGSEVIYWNKKLAPWRFKGSSYDEDGIRWHKGKVAGMRVFRTK